MALAALWKMSTYLQMTVKVNKCFSFFWSCDLRGEVEKRGWGGGGGHVQHENAVKRKKN